MTITPVTDNPNDNWFGFGEGKGSCTESYDFYEGTMTANRIFIGPAANRFDFIRAKILAEINPGENGNNQSITPPNAYPDVPSATAYKVDVQPFFITGQNTEDQNQITYAYVKIVVGYKIFPFGMPGGGQVDVDTAFIEENVESTTELIPIPYNFEVIDDSPGYALAGFKKVKGIREGKLNKVITIEHYKLTIPLLIEPNFELFSDYAGHTNDEYRVKLPSGYLARLQTMRYDGYSGISKRELSQGRLAWTITHNFGHYNNGWDTLPAAALSDPDDPDSEVTIINASITPRLYEGKDLNKLLYGVNFNSADWPELSP